MSPLGAKRRQGFLGFKSNESNNSDPRLSTSDIKQSGLKDDMAQDQEGQIRSNRIGSGKEELKVLNHNESTPLGQVTAPKRSTLTWKVLQDCIEEARHKMLVVETRRSIVKRNPVSDFSEQCPPPRTGT